MWQIHSWNQTRQTGTVSAPHFGPLPFGAAENPKGTRDFVVGEEVVVSLAGDPSDYRVELVREVRPKPQPEGTHCAAFDVIHAARFWDARLEEEEGDSLVFWFGRCCSHCEPGVLARFDGVTHWTGDHDDWAFDRPLLRYASEQEVRVHKLPSTGVAYCVVPEPLRPADDTEDPLFIVAKSVSVEVQRH